MNRFLALLLIGLPFCSVRAADWPTWRHDTSRSAVTTEKLPAKLSLKWHREFPPQQPAWPDDPRLLFDAFYQPIVVGKTLYLSSTRTDSLTAFDTETGSIRWCVYANGPVRFAPVAHKGRIYFGSDDGCLYCVEGTSGALLWKLNLAPEDRSVLGNDRLISVWPVRGGPVIVEDRLFVTTGIWPFEGTFLVSVDLSASSKIKNASKSASKAPTFRRTLLDEKLPHGFLAAITGNSKQSLLVPCGRSAAVSFDLNKGKATPTPVIFNISNKNKGSDYCIAGVGDWRFEGGAIRNIDSKYSRQTFGKARHPVFEADRVFRVTQFRKGRFGIKLSIQALSLKPEREELADRNGKKYLHWKLPIAWQFISPEVVAVPLDPKQKGYESLRFRWLQANPVRLEMKAGGRLYGHQANTIFALETPQANASAKISWKRQVEGTPGPMLAADGKLFVVTREGDLYCFSGEENAKPAPQKQKTTPLGSTSEGPLRARAVLGDQKDRGGFAVLLGLGSGALLEELLLHSKLRVLCVEPDAAKVAAARARLLAAGLYGRRASIIQGDPLAFGWPPYLASLLLCEDPKAIGLRADAAHSQWLFNMLRPYDGECWITTSAAQASAFEKAWATAAWPGATRERKDGWAVLNRTQAPPGAGTWTHTFGDASNSLMSGDKLVKAPLGVLWYGGPAGHRDLFWDRHANPPSALFARGRMFCQGPGILTATDLYTGRVLWKRKLPRDSKQRPVALRAVVAPNGDAIYLTHPKVCLKLDPVTGKDLLTIKAPSSFDHWERPLVKGELLMLPVRGPRPPKDGGPAPIPLKHSYLPIRELRVLNRQTGALQWSKSSEHSFVLLACGKQSIFVVDGAVPRWGLHPRGRVKSVRPKEKLYLKAFDLQSGEEKWRTLLETSPVWLSCSMEHDVVVITNTKKIFAFGGQDGRKLWERSGKGRGFGSKGVGPKFLVVLWNNQVICQSTHESYDIHTGKTRTFRHALTNKSVPWSFTANTEQGCSYAVAGEHLMTFRNGWGVCSDMTNGDRIEFKGFRSGCRNSLIPAGGVLNAPNFQAGCSCGYGFYTSLALVHRPFGAQWSTTTVRPDPKNRILRVGVNVNAPGSYRDEKGTLWMHSHSIHRVQNSRVRLTPENVKKFRRFPPGIKGKHALVTASGVTGIAAINFPMGPKDASPQDYTVRLYFAEVEGKAVGERVFDIAIQGKTVLEHFDVRKAAGACDQTVVKEFKGIKVGANLSVTFSAKKGEPILCGVEVTASTVAPKQDAKQSAQAPVKSGSK